MSAASGCMVCVTAQEMIPEAVEQDEPAGVVSIVLGFALMMALDVALYKSHTVTKFSLPGTELKCSQREPGALARP